MLFRLIVRCGGGCPQEDGPSGGLAGHHHGPPADHRGRQEVEGSARHRENQDEVFHPPRGEGGSEEALSDDLNLRQSPCLLSAVSLC